MNMLRTLVAVLLSVQTSASLATGRDCPGTVSLADLLANPDYYHGKALWVVAHATIEFENMTACASENEKQPKACLWLTIDDGPFNTDADYARYQSKLRAWEPFDFQTVAIHASFDRNSRGHFGLWPGGLGNVTEVQGYEGGWNFVENAALPRSPCAEVYRLPKPPIDRRAMVSGHRKLRNGDIDGAIVEFGRAIAIAPTNSGYYLIRAHAREKKRDYANAIADYTRAIEHAREDRDVIYSVRGAVKEQSGDLAGAVADYSRAIEINPKDADAYRRRGAAKRKMGDALGAAADLAKAEELDPVGAPH